MGKSKNGPCTTGGHLPPFPSPPPPPPPPAPGLDERQSEMSEIARLRAENARLRAAIRKAPHDECCRLGAWCDCWKKVALAGKEQSNG